MDPIVLASLAILLTVMGGLIAFVLTRSRARRAKAELAAKLEDALKQLASLQQQPTSTPTAASAARWTAGEIATLIGAVATLIGVVLLTFYSSYQGNRVSALDAQVKELKSERDSYAQLIGAVRDWRDLRRDQLINKKTKPPSTLYLDRREEAGLCQGSNPSLAYQGREPAVLTCNAGMLQLKLSQQTKVLFVPMSGVSPP